MWAEDKKVDGEAVDILRGVWAFVLEKFKLTRKSPTASESF